jgi:hypothetical protein
LDYAAPSPHETCHSRFCSRQDLHAIGVAELFVLVAIVLGVALG